MVFLEVDIQCIHGNKKTHCKEKKENASLDIQISSPVAWQNTVISTDEEQKQAGME